MELCNDACNMSNTHKMGEGFRLRRRMFMQTTSAAPAWAAPHAGNGISTGSFEREPYSSSASSTFCNWAGVAVPIARIWLRVLLALQIFTEFDKERQSPFDLGAAQGSSVECGEDSVV